MTGISVHEAISEQIGGWARGEEVDSKEAEKRSEEYIQRVWNDKETRIIEVLNGINIEPERIQGIIRTSQKRIATFFRMIWPIFRNHRYILHEQNRSFRIDGSVVWIRVDLCTREPRGSFVITDWKTGQSANYRTEPTQLNTYALWANISRREPISNILVQMVNLRTGEFSRKRFKDQLQLAETSEKVCTESENWSKMKSIDDYIPRPFIKSCRSCFFLRICSDGQAVVKR